MKNNQLLSEEERLRRLAEEQADADTDGDDEPSLLFDEDFQVRKDSQQKPFVSSNEIDDEKAIGAKAYPDPFESFSQTETTASREEVEKDLQGRVAHIPSGDKADIRSLHEDMVLSEREMANSEGYIASAGQSRADYQKHLKEQFGSFDGQQFESLPSPNEVDFGDQAQIREYSDYYDLRGYNHHKTISHYTNDQDKAMRLEAASDHLSSFQGRMESDARYQSLSRHIDRQCEKLGINEEQKEEMRANADQDFTQSGAITLNRGILSAKEENEFGVNRDEAELHKLRATREDMLSNDKTHTEEYQELMAQIEEQRELVGLEEVQTQEEALEQLMDEQLQEDQIEQLKDEQLHEDQVEELNEEQTQEDQVEQLEAERNQDEEMDAAEQAEDELTDEKDLDDYQSRALDEESELEDEQKMTEGSPELTQGIAEDQEEAVTIEKLKDQEGDLSHEDQQNMSLEEIRGERSSFDSFAMGGGDESLEIDESDQMEFDEMNLDDWEIEDDLETEEDLEEDLDFSEEPDLVEENPLEMETDEDRQLDMELEQMVSEHLEQESDLGEETELEQESDLSEETDLGLEPEMESEELDEAYDAIKDNDEALEFEANGGLTDEQDSELDDMMNDIEDQQEDRALGIDMDEDQKKEDELSR